MFEDVKNCGAGKFVSRGSWIHPDRVINSYEVIYVIYGDVFLEENGTRYHLQKNDMLILYPGLRHFGFAESTNTSFYWAHWIGGPEIALRQKYQKNLDSHQLSLLFKQLMHYRAEEKSGERLDYLTRLVLMELFSLESEKNENRIASEATAWIRANRDVPLKAAQVAAHFGYNADYISRVFKKYYGKSVKELIDSEKIQYIEELLLTSDLTLGSIAQQTGFAEYKYFLKFFQYHTGVTPSQFRTAYPNAHINSK